MRSTAAWLRIVHDSAIRQLWRQYRTHLRKSVGGGDGEPAAGVTEGQRHDDDVIFGSWILVIMEPLIDIIHWG